MWVKDTRKNNIIIIIIIIMWGRSVFGIITLFY